MNDANLWPIIFIYFLFSGVNIMNTEIFKKFNDNGKEFSEYGLTCEMWILQENISWYNLCGGHQRERVVC